MRALVLTGIAMGLSSCYVLNQGRSLLRYQAAAEPIDAILTRGAFADGDQVSAQTLGFLREVDRIRDYSAGLGLVASRNYTTLVPTEREHLADVVNAAGELSFERQLWWWPFVGRLPYKGYYDPADATRLAERLRDQGLDVWVRPVDAFSTLGVLRDPLFEFMVDYDRYTIANLIIHEQAHATLFLRGQSQFNEEFATFVGDVGAAAYMRLAGASADELAQIGAREADRGAARALVLSLREELSAVYASDAGTEDKRAAKSRAIQAWQTRIESTYESMFQTEMYRALADIPVNNAYIDLYVSYTEDLELFSAFFDSVGQDMARFVEEMLVLAHPNRIPTRDLRRLARRDPKAYIRLLLLDSSNE